MIRSVLVALFAFGSLTANAEPFTGKIYEQGSNRTKLLYNLERTEQKTGDTLKANGKYTSPDGKEVVTEETIVVGGKLQKYTLNQLQTGQSGSLEVKGDKVIFSWTKDGETDTDDEDWKPNLIIAPTTVEYLKKNWDKILKGEDVEVRFGALDRKETVGFKYFKIEELKVDGKDAIKVKMKPTSFIIAAIVKPLIFTFEKSNARLLELYGRALPKRLEDGKWKDLDGDIVYSYKN